MSEKVRYKESAKAAKKVKRLAGGLKQRRGITQSGTMSKPEVTCLVSGKELERLRSRNYQFRVIGRADGIEIVRDGVKEHDVAYLIEISDTLLRKLKTMRDDSRKESRTNGGGGGGTPPSRIFHRLVDEDKMSDCILRIKDAFFHEEKECTICQKEECNLYDFFILVRFYFCYIGILDKKISQLAFCRYLNENVFGGNDIVKVRNFNNYAKIPTYMSFEGFLSDNKEIRFDSRPQLPRPVTETFLLAPFQEIGWKFQHSQYFKELRKEKETVQAFVI